ncbi:MAG TPA: serine/threonine-protein kinase, partial [Polyangium sp.]|nr:serine/threonine-protein kinase [Polyangium sp.]
MPADEPSNNVLLLDRYRVYDEIAAGGMATVHLGTLVGDVGFSRLVAVKRLHPHFSKDRSIVTMFTDEARIAARIRHPNVVTTLDVISRDGEVFLVMEYVHGEPFSKLLLSTSKRKEKVPPRIVGAVMSSALHGLHAAHEAKDVRGRPLGIVHRDISPQNIIVGTDGIARVLDFGIARAAGRLYQTNDGAVKGKLAYMSPEQLMSEPIDRRSDIYAAGVVLWEALTCKRLHAGGGDALVRSRITQPKIDPPSMHVKDLPPYFDEVAMRAMCPAAGDRFPTALAMAEALEVAGMIANPSEVAAWVESLASETLAERATIIERIENAERRNSMTSVTDEIDTHRTPQQAEPSPHLVEATVKMSTSALIAAPIKPPAPPAKSDAFAGPDTTTVTLRRDIANTRAPLPPPVPPPLSPPVALAPPVPPSLSPP